MLKNIPKALNFGCWGVFKRFSAIVLSGFLARILFNLFFHLRFGFHAVNHVELWLYYAVAEGTNLPGGGESDVTVWILRGLSFLFPEHTFYVVSFLGAFLACLIGGLIYVLMRARFSERKALLAGFLYVFMVQPISLSVVSF
ncbi:MAG: hypothetical protein GF334_13785, partial [Candidatus Altiarchaeales archaeon]|nr:hypothetical protein [Candidatus Altiarchaeales archaeon]